MSSAGNSPSAGSSLGPTQRKYWAQGQSLGFTLAALRGTHGFVRKWYLGLSYRELQSA